MADPGPTSEPGAHARWRLRLLGGFDLDDGRQRLTRLHSRAAVGLIARLALAPQRAHAREELAALLWPDADAETGRARLRQTLSTLRATLEPRHAAGGAPVIEADRRVLRLVAGAIRCDAHEFEQACRRGDAACAMSLYRGELLPGFYDEWIVDERLRLQALADRLDLRGPVTTRAPAGAQPPQPGRAASTSAPATASPRAHADAASPQSVAGEAASLPRYLGPLFGAESTLAGLRERVLAHRLVTLRGAGGAGKTRLAVEIAQRLQDEGAPFDHVGFVSWVGCRSAEQAADQLALALGVRADGDAMHAVARALAGRRVLLVLDNAEQLDGEAVGLVASLAARLPQLHLLVTSRRPLALDGEHELQLDPLPGPPAGSSLAQVQDSPAVQLFLSRARATRADFFLHAGNVEAIAELVRALDGLPLALELAAARVRTLPPARLLGLLRAPAAQASSARWSLLARSGARSAADPRHASMLAVVDWSWRLLEPSQAALLRLLAFAPAAVSGELVEQAALHAGLATREADARMRLDALAAASLLRCRPGGDDRLWWSLPEPVADVARDHGDMAPAAAAARAAWRHALARWAAALPATVPLRELDETLPALLGALHAALPDGAATELAELLLVLAPAWAERSLPAGGVHALCEVLAAGCLPDDLAARAHALAAQLCAASGRRGDALAHADAAARRWPQEPAARAGARLQVARVRWRCAGDVAATRQLLDAAEAEAAGGATRRVLAAVLTLRATMANEVDHDARTAAALYRHALAVHEQDPEASAHARRGLRYNLAITDIYAGRAADALPVLDALRDEATAAHDRHLLAQLLNARGSALDALGRRDEAEVATREALAEAWATLETENALYALWNLGPLALARGDAARAARLMGFAERFWRQNYGALSASDRRDVARTRRRCRQALGRAAALAAWGDGAPLELPAAVRLALA